MNLYRSFGNLMEVWVAEDHQCSGSEFVGNKDEDSPAPSSDTRTDSLDSGVETSSSDASFPAASCLVSADKGEVFTPERDIDELSTSSTPLSPSLSSPAPSSSTSPLLCPSRAQEDPAALDHKVEQALMRINSKNHNATPKPVTPEELLRRPRCSSLPPKRHPSDSGRGPSRTVHPSVFVWQESERWRRESSTSCDQQRSEDLCVENRKDLSPGLIYLEQVCQMLEEIARQHMQSRTSQIRSAVLQEHRDTEVFQDPQTRLSDSEEAEERLSSSQRFDNSKYAESSSPEPQPPKKNPYKHFRRRSASDTSVATLHLKKLSADSRGQHLSTNDLSLRAAEGEQKKLESIMEETDKPKRNWKLRIGSLKRESTKSQQMQAPERGSTRRRLSQLFRRKKTILPE